MFFFFRGVAFNMFYKSTLKILVSYEKLKTKMMVWVKVFKNEPIKICGRNPLKNVLGPFLNTLTHIMKMFLRVIN